MFEELMFDFYHGAPTKSAETPDMLEQMFDTSRRPD
jgi:hypothetical protein